MSEHDEELEEFRTRAEAAAKAAEEASIKANSEAGFAFHAKEMSEEHAKAISGLKGTADVEFASLSAVKQKMDEAASAATVAKTAAEADAKLAADARGTANSDAAIVKAAHDRSVQDKAAIEKIHTDVSNALTVVTTDAANVAAAKATIEATVAPVQASQKQVTDILAQVTVDGASIKKSEADGVALIALLNEAGTKINASQERFDQFEGEIDDKRKSFLEIHQKIENLLPGATSASLASAFRDQRSRFRTSQYIWLVTFLVAIGLLLWTGLHSLPISDLGDYALSAKLAAQVAQPGTAPAPSVAASIKAETRETWESLARHFVSRLPLVLPLIWLGIYAGRNYMLAIRGEEEYAFKEAVSTAFEGYKREISTLANVPASITHPIVSFCENFLKALTRRPGRIYEGRQQDDMTPMGSISKFVTDKTETIKTVTEKVK